MAGLPDVIEVALSLQRFAWPDYLLFVIMLTLCALIGVYFGYCAPGNHDEAEYLMGGRKMQTIPIALSLVASYISGITLIGLPTEVYVYGMQILYGLLGTGVWCVVFGWGILPVFHELQLISLYEYLQMRFDKRIRLFGSISFAISLILWMPIVIFVPALAFNQVTGINIHIISPAVCTICVFYTCVGGMKAVVWTDVVQTVSMLGCILLVAALGTANVGGMFVVFQRAVESGRLEAPVFDPDPLVRQTLWACFMGSLCNQMVSCGLNQAMMQRFLALPSLRKAQRSVCLFTIGLGVLSLLCSYCGLLIYATYSKCDPVTTKLARQKDQVLPLLVMETLGLFPGLPGLFVAGIFSAALRAMVLLLVSSLSTGLNSMAAVVVEDFWRPMLSSSPSERAVNIVMRAVVLVFGAVFVALVFVVEKLGVVLQLSASLSAISNGPMLAVFIEALFIPWVNSTGCFAGAAAGLSFMSWLALSAQHSIATGQLTFPVKPTSVAGCTYTFNTTDQITATVDIQELEVPLWLLRISYQWYPAVGALVSLTVALVVSLLFPSQRAPLSRSLFSPLVRGFITEETEKVAVSSEKQFIKPFEESSL